MLIHALKQIFRSLWRYKSFSIVNILGLSVGIAAVVLIFLIADYEKRFDRLSAGSQNIYRVVHKGQSGGKTEYSGAVPYPTARLLRNELPGVLATEIHHSNDATVRIANNSPFEEKNVVFADSLFFDVFDFAAIDKFFITGDAKRALSAPNKVVLTESVAKRYFGSANPIGQVIKLNAKVDLEVGAIVKDVPATTHLPFTMLISYASLTKDYVGGFDLDAWGLIGNAYCYVRTDKNASVNGITQSLKSIVQKNADSDRDKREQYYLQPLDQIHFDPSFETSNPSYTVSPKYLMMLMLLGGFIILIACINYINLSTSLAFTKSKEVGIRKTIGASKFQLFLYYMSETLVLTFIASAIGFAIAGACIPLIDQLLDKSITIQQLAGWHFMLGGVTGLILVSFISGTYPALILAGFRPIESLKNQLSLPTRASTVFRKALVVFQFTTSIALIICTLIIAKQMHYSSTKSLGFNKNAVVEVSLPLPDSTRIEAFRSLVQNQTGVQEMSFCLGAPISDNGISTTMQAPGLPENGNYEVKILACDKNYLETYGIKLIAGRWFFAGEEKNLGSGLVVNETMAKTLGYKNAADAIGKKVSIGINEYNPQIIGVVKDFHTSSLHESIRSAAMMPFPFFYYAAGIRIDPGNMKNTLSNIERAFKKVYPEYVYQLSFIDDQLAKLYQQETRNYSLFKAFSAISIFICCIGLWGLIAFVVVRKTKEIGIRKVLGANVSNIVRILSMDFLKLIVIALVVASPVAWYFMNAWLQNFAYRIHISWWLFVLAGFIALVIAFITISFQAIKAAVANPVKNLRTE
ncbi:MAG TPA: ABC transporter permease [Chitinophagaceae bacterium]|nr:ABC transporter permease [Chitinophagaceae bacterium]